MNGELGGEDQVGKWTGAKDEGDEGGNSDRNLKLRDIWGGVFYMNAFNIYA